jgi:hypothetical protein
VALVAPLISLILVVPGFEGFFFVLLVGRLVGNPAMATIAGDVSLIALLGFEFDRIGRLCASHEPPSLYYNIIVIDYIYIHIYTYIYIYTYAYSLCMSMLETRIICLNMGFHCLVIWDD